MDKQHSFAVDSINRHDWSVIAQVKVLASIIAAHLGAEASPVCQDCTWVCLMRPQFFEAFGLARCDRLRCVALAFLGFQRCNTPDFGDVAPLRLVAHRCSGGREGGLGVTDFRSVGLVFQQTLKLTPGNRGPSAEA